jgi:hypothetical protein
LFDRRLHEKRSRPKEIGSGGSRLFRRLVTRSPSCRSKYPGD